MKKVFLSLAALAMVAVGTVSCGSDDSSPTPPVVDDTPGTGLTENFIQVNNDQTEIMYSIYAVHVDGAGQDAPIKEYTLQDGTVVAAFEFISHNGSAPGSLSGTDNTWTTLLTKVDTSIPAGTEGRYVFPFQTDGTTLLGGFTTTMNGTDYTYADGASFDVTDLQYATSSAAGNMTYTLEGTDEADTSITLKTNLNGEIEGLYSLNASASKGLNTPVKAGQLTLRKSLN